MICSLELLLQDQIKIGCGELEKKR